jgi:isoleucyl-tRNA synthetase
LVLSRTTTPWTIPFNLTVLAHPGFTYCIVELQSGEQWVVAQDLVGAFLEGQLGLRQDVDYTVVERVSGAQLGGVVYEHPFAADTPIYSQLKAQNKHVRFYLALFSFFFFFSIAGFSRILFVGTHGGFE